MKIYFDTLSNRGNKSNPYFIADCINWCDQHIGQRHFLQPRSTWGWDTIKPNGHQFELLAPPALGIEFFNEASATAFLLRWR